MTETKEYLHKRLDIEQKDMYIEVLEELLDCVLDQLLHTSDYSCCIENEGDIIEHHLNNIDNDCLNNILRIVENESIRKMECDNNA